MANICSFDMCIKGDRENIRSFVDALSQKGNIYMGRGGVVDVESNSDEYDKPVTFIGGHCKWSINGSMVSDAISMRNEPNIWAFEKAEYSKLEFVTLWEACKCWNLDVEVYSSEPGCCFQEHIICKQGRKCLNESEEYYEYDVSDYETKKEAEEDLEIELTDEEWNSQDGDGYIKIGGFGDWIFEILGEKSK